MKNANSLFVYMIKFENCILTFKHGPKNPPLPWWEGSCEKIDSHGGRAGILEKF
jgi:hypothetical protein